MHVDTSVISVAAVVPRPAGAPRAACVDGARACPPEDCGGTGGYEDLLAAVADPKHEDHDDMVAWLDGNRSELAGFDPRLAGPFDPERFDPKQADAMIRKLSGGERWEWRGSSDDDS